MALTLWNACLHMLVQDRPIVGLAGSVVLGISSLALLQPRLAIRHRSVRRVIGLWRASAVGLIVFVAVKAPLSRVSIGYQAALAPSATVLLTCLYLVARRILRHVVPPESPVASGDGRTSIAMMTRLASLTADPSQLRVSYMVQRLAQQAGRDAHEASELQAAAMYYLIGRIGMPGPLARQGGPRDRSGKRLLRRHPAIGARILGGSRVSLLDRAAELALCHQERWNGTGYPRGLSGLEIPLSARIVSVAAAFDALLSGVGDQKPLSLNQVVWRLEQDAAQAFDPALVRIFLDDLPAMFDLRDRLVHPTPSGQPDGLRDVPPPMQAPTSRLHESKLSMRPIMHQAV